MIELREDSRWSLLDPIPYPLYNCELTPNFPSPENDEHFRGGKAKPTFDHCSVYSLHNQRTLFDNPKTMHFPLLALFSAAAMLKHIVMFDFKRNVSEVDVDRIKLGLLDLPKAISSIQSYEIGYDLLLESGQKHPLGKNRRLSWTATFRSAAAYEAYARHPDHVAFLQQLKPLLLRRSRAAIQYEMKPKAKQVVVVPSKPEPSRSVKVLREASKLFLFGMLLLAVLELGWLDTIASKDWW